jgi:hypothetical protein
MSVIGKYKRRVEMSVKIDLAVCISTHYPPNTLGTGCWFQGRSGRLFDRNYVFTGPN